MRGALQSGATDHEAAEVKKFRRGFLVLLSALAVGFGVLWILGPAPVSIGPYMQNVSASSAEVCWFSERPVRISVEVTGEARVDGARNAPATTHRIRLTNLEPGTRYDYTVYDGKTRERLGSGSFRTPPTDDSRSFTFAAVGDSGKAPLWFRMRDFGWGRLRGLFPRPNQWRVGEWIAAARPDQFVHLGDIIYSKDQLSAYEETFYRPFEQVLTRTPLVATFGNHDLHTWKHPEFFRLFHGPRALDPEKGYTDFSHTFVYGGVRFLVLDPFWQEWQPGSAASTWLESTLARNTLGRTFVIIHSPPFSDEAGEAGDTRVRERIWPTLQKHRVDLVITGDSHNYQRFKPIGGVTLVIVGTGGKSIRPVAPTSQLAASFERFGFLLVKVTRGRVEGEFWDGGEEPVDRFAIGQ